MPYGPPESKQGAAPVYHRSIADNMLIERDVAVTLRDGVRLYVDVFRPVDEKPAPPIIAWGPYGKHGHTNYSDNFPNCGVKPEHFSKWCAFEAPDPLYWVAHGYAVINADKRGNWYAEGDATFLSPEEAQDFHDLIEWAGTQPWSNGKVGLSGVSYLASSQWRVAETNPPHLAAINPWEGWADTYRTYREVVRHGGIPETFFWPYLPGRWGYSTTRVEDLALETRERPLFDDYWQSKACDFSRIQVPAFIVASWTDHGMHTRGTLEGFKQIASKHKWLEVHGRKKWAYYYEPDSVERLRQFFDRFLKGNARTQYSRLYLNAGKRTLEQITREQESSCQYAATDQQRTTFDYVFTEPTNLIGHMKLRLWAATDAGDDMDLFIAIQKLDRNGTLVPFAFWAHFDDGPVALGWLRASHRELDEKKSTAWQPVLKHQRELKLKPGEIVPLEIEIWPSGTHFDKGETLRLVIQGKDIHDYPKPVMCDRHEDTVNQGNHIIYSGGKYASYLLVPVVQE
ncbi:MAG: putative hydrolase [Gammaproteobacteria bacterium]|nr:putative hydrolase [Gammaproteobacteria bacterium]